MFALVELTNKKALKQGITVSLYLPLRNNLFDGHYTDWPPACAVWEGIKVYGDVDWNDDDDELGELTIDWSDGDQTTLDLKNEMEVKPGRIITFHSQRHNARTPLTVEEIRPL